MALRIDFIGTLIWTIVLVAGLYVLQIFAPKYYCPGAITLFIIILIIANRKLIMRGIGGRSYY